MALATLSIDIVAQIAALQAGLDKAGRLSEKALAGIEARFAKMQSVAVDLGGLIGGAVSVAGLSAFLKSTVDGLDALNDLSDATGSTIENLSALEDIAARTGTTLETVGAAVVKLNQFLAAADKGSAQANVLKQIGLSAEELRQLDPAVALKRVADALAGYANDGNKARLVQELFGKSIKEVAPLLNDLAAAGELNATVTAKQAQEAERFNKQLADFTKNGTDAARTIAGPLVRSLNQFFAEFNAGTETFGSVSSAVYNLGLSRTFEDAGEGVAFYVKRLKELRAERDELASRDVPGVALLDVEDEIAKLSKYEAYYRRLFALTAADNGQSDAAELARRGRGGAALPSLPADLGGNKPKAAAPLLRPVTAEIGQATQRALQALQDTDFAKIQRLNEDLDSLFAMRASGLGGGPEIDAAIERLRNELEKLNPQAQLAAETQKRLNELLAATPSAQMEALAEQARLLALQLSLATDPERAQQLVEALQQTGEAMGRLNTKTQETSEFARQAAANIQDALGDGLQNALEGNFDAIGQGWSALLRRMVAQALAAQLNNALFGKDFAKTGQIGGALLKGIQFFNPDFSGFFAEGGYIPAGGWGITGEAGPEIVRGPATVIPMGGGGSGGGGLGLGGSLTINQYLTVGDGVSRGQFAAALELTRQQIKAEIRDEAYRGRRVGAA